MSGFKGLTLDQLSYFAMPPEQRSDTVKDSIRRALDELTSEMAQAWRTDWRLFVGNIHQSDHSAWAKLQPDSPVQTPHLSVSVGPAGVDLFGNVETREPFVRFRKALSRNPAGLTQLLRELGSSWPPDFVANPSWRFRVVRRIQVRPRKFEHWMAVDVTATTLSSFSDDQLGWFIDAVTEQPSSESAPQIMLIRSLPAALVIGDDGLAERLATHATALEPFFSWLGEPVR